MRENKIRKDLEEAKHSVRKQKKNLKFIKNYRKAKRVKKILSESRQKLNEEIQN